MTDANDRDAARAVIEAHDQVVARLRARAAAAEFSLHIVAGPAGRAEYMLCRWGWSGSFADVAAVDAALDRAGAK